MLFGLLCGFFLFRSISNPTLSLTPQRPFQYQRDLLEMELLADNSHFQC